MLWEGSNKKSGLLFEVSASIVEPENGLRTQSYQLDWLWWCCFRRLHSSCGRKYWIDFDLDLEILKRCSNKPSDAAFPWTVRVIKSPIFTALSTERLNGPCPFWISSWTLSLSLSSCVAKSLVVSGGGFGLNWHWVLNSTQITCRCCSRNLERLWERMFVVWRWLELDLLNRPEEDQNHYR